MAERSGRDRAVIARWEQGAVAPSLDTLVELVRSCGFDIPLELVRYDPEPDRQVAALQLLSPERRVDRLLDRLADRKAGL
jgi:transcriptional regulator with XRE-family HTH domain